MTATKTRAAARLSVQVQQVWIGRKSGFGSGVPWRYSDKNPFGLTEVKYPPLLLANVHRFQMRLQPSTRPLHTTPLLNRGTRQSVNLRARAVDRAALTRMNRSCTPQTPQSPTSGELCVSIDIIVIGDRGQACAADHTSLSSCGDSERLVDLPASRPYRRTKSNSPVRVRLSRGGPS